MYHLHRLKVEEKQVDEKATLRALSIQQKFRFEISENLPVQWNGTFRFHRPDPSHRAFDSHQIQT